MHPWCIPSGELGMESVTTEFQLFISLILTEYLGVVAATVFYWHISDCQWRNPETSLLFFMLQNQISGPGN